MGQRKEASRNKQVCIGKLDTVTGELVPNKKNAQALNPAALKKPITATTQVYGSYLILNALTEELDMEQRLSKHFPKTYRQILSIVYFLTHRGVALHRLEQWSATHKHPYDKVLSSQEISNLLLDQSEDARQSFFKGWRDIVDEKEYLCFDITSVSSYSKKNEYVEYGYNRDQEDLPQINLAMLFGQQNALPVYFRRLPGSIPDVKTLTNLLVIMNAMGYNKLNLILDKGFYSEDNVNNLFDGGHKFTIGCSTHLKWI